MPIQDRLAANLGRKDQAPNHELADAIVAANDKISLNELITLFDQEQDKRVLMDASLTIAYVAERSPELVVSKLAFLLDQLTHRINRVSWASMIALSHLAPLVLEELYRKLVTILDAMDQGGVVGRDHGFRILLSLYGEHRYSEDVFIIIIEQLVKAPHNQLGQYVERLMGVLRPSHKLKLVEVLMRLRSELDNEFHLKRLDKNLKKLCK